MSNEPFKMKTISLVGLSREDLLVIAERGCGTLRYFANQVTTDEGDCEKTEQEFGIDASEVVEMAHDNMILQSRAVLNKIMKDFPSTASLTQDQ